MEYKGGFTIEDFEELIRELNEQGYEPMRFWPRTKQEDDLLKEALRNWNGNSGVE